MKSVNNICMNIQIIKEKDKEYLMQLQKFYDLVDNISDENLKKSIIYQRLKCEKILEQLIIKFLKN